MKATYISASVVDASIVLALGGIALQRIGLWSHDENFMLRLRESYTKESNIYGWPKRKLIVNSVPGLLSRFYSSSHQQ